MPHHWSNQSKAGNNSYINCTQFYFEIATETRAEQFCAKKTLARQQIARGFYPYTWWAQLVPSDK